MNGEVKATYSVRSGKTNSVAGRLPHWPRYSSFSSVFLEGHLAVKMERKVLVVAIASPS